MKILVMDAMGVIFQAADDVAEVLVPFVREHSHVSTEQIKELYHQCSLGEFISATFWERLGISPSLEDDYLSRHSLVNDVQEFLFDAKKYFSSIWCLSNDISEWSIKLRSIFSLETLFDGFVISGDVGFRKPSPDIYKSFCDISAASPKDVIFIDDRRENVEAAISYGMQAILYGSNPLTIEGYQCAKTYKDLSAILFNNAHQQRSTDRPCRADFGG